MRAQCRFLSDSERERIHNDSLKLLADTGIRFMSSRALDIMRRSGASVDSSEKIARIPRDLVAEALRRAPKSFTLGARNEAFNFPMPSGWSGYTLDGEATFAIDFDTGERRNGLSKDLIASLRVFEELPLGTVVWPNVMLSDIPIHSADIRATFLSLTHSSKHIQHEVHNVRQVPYIIEGLASVLGGEDAVRRRKIFSVTYCTIPPLTHDADMCDACLELASFHVPILPFPMPACGSTGPASLYSDIAVANAESLSALVLFQMASPGTPIIFGHAAGIMNFSSGGFVEGAPESNLINTGLGEMARFYNLPNTQAGCLTDAKAPGAQATMEKMITTLPLVLSGADIINGIGEIETSQLLIQEQIVVDHEMAVLCKRLKDSINVGDATDYLEDVRRVGPGGHFLMEDSTIAACRSSEFCSPHLVDRNTFEQWTELGKPDMYSKARTWIGDVLSTQPKHPLSHTVAAALDDILRRADNELSDLAIDTD